MPFLENPLVVTIIMLAWGIAVRYHPALKDWPNRFIWAFNTIIGVLAKLVAPTPAEAGVFSGLSVSLGWFIVPVQAIVARQLFETFVKPTLEHFGILGYPATPVPRSKHK